MQFYPKHMLTKPFTAVTMANVVSVVFAAPLAAGLMRITALGLAGWQWLFILEGIPSVLLGIVMLVLVPNDALTAWFLNPDEREALHQVVHGDDADAASKRVRWSQMPRLVLEAARLPLLWYFACAGLSWVLCIFSLNSWTAIIIKIMLAGTVLVNSTSTGGTSAVNSLHATLLSAIPYFTAAIAMWLVATSSQHLKEKELHVGVPWMIGSIVLTFFEPLYKRSFAAGFAVIAITLTLAYSSQSVMFARVTDSLDARHAGIGVAIFNAVGAAIGGFVGPLVIGAFVQRMGTFVSSMVAMGALLCFAGLMMVVLNIASRLIRRRRKLSQPARRAPSGSVIADSRAELLIGPTGGFSYVTTARNIELAAGPNPRAHSVSKM